MKEWWKEVTVYQIYPKSFADSNGDGIGDINGIISRLDYLKNLGVDVIWLSPVYKSPDVDNGYDVQDYRKISKTFGTMKDFDRLLLEVHKRGMKLIIDGVFNHTSDKNIWFRKSRKSKNSPYKDYYFWRKAKNGEEPNNWKSTFGGSAWEYDRKTKEYYLHIFDKSQPDLNWDNRKVRMEIYKVMKWWLDKGVDGFRFDVINFISKTPGLSSIPVKGHGYSYGHKYYINGPKIETYLKEMNREVLSKYDVMTVGETAASLNDVKTIRRYVSSRNRELHMVFHENNEIRSIKSKNASSLTALERRYNRLEWNLSDLKRNFTVWQKGLEGSGWGSVYLGNHDYPRIISRFGDDGKYRVESGKMLATMLFTLRGTPFIYQGEEIGMINPRFRSIKDFRDVAALKEYKEYAKRYKDNAAALALLAKVSRDNARTPIQWDESKNAGFSKGSPWIKVSDDYKEINVAKALGEKRSIFYHYKKLIELRKKYKIFVLGRYGIMPQDDPGIYAYTRSREGEMLIIMLNFTAGKTTFKMPKHISYSKAQLLIGNYPDSGIGLKSVALRPYEARVYKLKLSSLV